MFWNNKRSGKAGTYDVSEIVSKVGKLSAEFYRQHQLIKSRSSLPCSWFKTRECFLQAYEKEYRELPKQLHDSYLLTYADLAFFVEDHLSQEFEIALSIATKCRSERMQKLGLSEDEALSRRSIASIAVKAMERKEIFAQLAREVSCPRVHLVLLAETLSYCTAQYRTMYDEWVAHANFLSFTSKKDA